MNEIMIREVLGDYALELPWNDTPLFFNSRRNALNVKRIIEVDCSVPNSSPACDMVEVVRCKDCAYYEANCCFNPQWDLESSTELPLVREIDFCSYGERKDGEGE